MEYELSTRSIPTSLTSSRSFLCLSFTLAGCFNSGTACFREFISSRCLYHHATASGEVEYSPSTIGQVYCWRPCSYSLNASILQLCISCGRPIGTCWKRGCCYRCTLPIATERVCVWGSPMKKRLLYGWWQGERPLQSFLGTAPK